MRYNGDSDTIIAEADGPIAPDDFGIAPHLVGSDHANALFLHSSHSESRVDTDLSQSNHKTVFTSLDNCSGALTPTHTGGGTISFKYRGTCTGMAVLAPRCFGGGGGRSASKRPACHDSTTICGTGTRLQRTRRGRRLLRGPKVRKS